MPLIHSGSDAAFKTNVKTLMGEVGKSPHVQSRQQALAIAYATKRRGKAEGGPIEAPKPNMLEEPAYISTMGNLIASRKKAMSNPGKADGGHVAGLAMGGASHFGLAGMPWYARQEARSLGQVHSGPIVSSVPGRTDKHNMAVGSGSYIVPADVVSHIGQNNTQAGHAKLNQMFSGGPYGMHTMPLGKTHFANARPPRMSDEGGARGSGNPSEPVDIVTAGGEYTIPPETVAKIGNGDVRLGHDILDAWVLKTRKEHIRTLQKLPGPAKS